MAQGVTQFKKAGKFEIRRLLFTLILILCPPKSIKNLTADLSNFNRPLSFSYAHRTYSYTCSTRPRKATFTTQPVCLRAAEPCHRSGAQPGFYVTGDHREAFAGLHPQLSGVLCQEILPWRSRQDLSYCAVAVWLEGVSNKQSLRSFR